MEWMRPVWMQSPQNIHELKYGDIFLGVIGARLFTCMKCVHTAQDWVLVLADLTQDGIEQHPILLSPEVLEKRRCSLRRLSGAFQFERLEPTHNAGRPTLGDGFAANGSLGLGAGGEPILHLLFEGGVMQFDLTTGRGFNKPHLSVWHRSWRMNWTVRDETREFFTVAFPREGERDARDPTRSCESFLIPRPDTGCGSTHA